MRSWMFALGLAAVAGPAAAQAPKKALYDRLGGIDGITAVTDEFIKRAAADGRINQKFGKTDIPRLRLHLIEQVCGVTGGPCEYSGRDMKTAHQGMAVTEGEFTALVEDLVAALDHFQVPAAEKNELLGILGPLKDAIVEVKGNATGTPLPPGFKPAPALSPERVKAGPKMARKPSP
jgi:hemoglobin